MLASARAIVVAGCVAAVALPASAEAAHPKAGGWVGKYQGYDSSKIRFKVTANRKRVRKFREPGVTIVCGLDLQGMSTYIPTAKVRRSGRFSGRYVLDESDPKHSYEQLKGQFTSPRKAKGTVHIVTSSCNVTLKFSAHHA